MILLTVPLSTIDLSLFPCCGGAAVMHAAPFLFEDCSVRQGPALPLVTCVSIQMVFRVTQGLGLCPTPHPSSTKLAFTSSFNVSYFPLPHADS